MLSVGVTLDVDTVTLTLTSNFQLLWLVVLQPCVDAIATTGSVPTAYMHSLHQHSPLGLTAVHANARASQGLKTDPETRGAPTLCCDGVGDDAVHHADRVVLPVQDLLARTTLREACAASMRGIKDASSCRASVFPNCGRVSPGCRRINS